MKTIENVDEALSMFEENSIKKAQTSESLYLLNITKEPSLCYRAHRVSDTL